MVSVPGFFSASLSGAQSSGAGADEELDAAEGWSPAFVDSSTGAQATVASSSGRVARARPGVRRMRRS